MIYENIRMALKSILSNKVRSLLTMLGIIIGIASVIMIISIGTGAQNKLMGEISRIGKAAASVSVDAKKAEDSDYLTLEDLDAMQQAIPSMVAATPVLQAMGSIEGRSEDYDAIFMCGTEHLPELSGVAFTSGRNYTQNEYKESRYVCLVDESTAQKLFGSTDVTGLSVDVTISRRTATLKIVGVTESNMMFQGGVSMLYIPYTTFTAITGQTPSIANVYLLAQSDEQVDGMCASALKILERRHNNSGQDIYSAESMNQYVDTLNTVINLFQTFVAAVAAISLLVGGIGVMNIMLVAVTERTREIGIRKSLGARTGSILAQFLTESGILTLLGGIIGIILGAGGALAVGIPLDVQPILSPQTILFSVIFSCSVGIFFGMYPARKAAKLRPIDALRHE